MSELVNTRKPLDLLLGSEADELLTALAASGNNQEKILILENFLKNRLSQAKKNLSIIDEAINYIDAFNGCISIEAVAKHFKSVAGTWKKNFLKKWVPPQSCIPG